MSAVRQAPILSPTATEAPAPNPRKRGRTACTSATTSGPYARIVERQGHLATRQPSLKMSRQQRMDLLHADAPRGSVTELRPRYTRALEERVAFLETALNELGNGQSVDEQPPAKRPALSAQHNALGEVVELLSMGNFEAPAYIGSSSGLNLALNLGEMVQATVWNKAIPSHKSQCVGRRESTTSTSDKHGGSNGSHAITMQELVAHSAEPPSDALGHNILAAYFNQIHPRYPFLDPQDIWALHKDRMTLASTPVSNLTKLQRFGVFKLYMIYAIGAMLLQLTEKHTTSPPEHIFAARESRTTGNIEAMALLVIYHLRSLSSFGIWYMIGLAMRTGIDLGLHRKQSETHFDHSTVQMRRRLFWSVYSLERTIAISMGRPFSIPDRVIDVELPDDEPEASAPPSPGGPPVKKNSLASATLLFKLRRIESKIQHSIYRADKPLSSLTSKMDRFYQDLEAWKLELKTRLSGAELNYPILHYHRALRLLVQPFLALLPPTDPYYTLCMRASGDVCQAHKKLHQTLDYGHSFIAVQTVFVSGITLLYGLWTQLQAVWSVSLANDIRACSLVLFVMGERASWVRKYRDAFELLVNATMEKLQSGDGRLAETAAAQVHASTNKVWTPADDGTKPSPDGDQDAWRVVAELANWIDQEEGSPVWMPDFETLQSLGQL
ncbi:hypothetical protein SCUP234_04906 [Seiridium cupressi]